MLMLFRWKGGARVPEAADRVPKQEAAARGQKGHPQAVQPHRRARVQDAQRGQC